jgi:hypothetical protein
MANSFLIEARRRRDPVRFFITTRALKDLCQNRADQGSSIVVEQLVESPLQRRLRPVEERHRDTGVNEH